jgi:hypothetical protein
MKYELSLIRQSQCQQLPVGRVNRHGNSMSIVLHPSMHPSCSLEANIY